MPCGDAEYAGAVPSTWRVRGRGSSTNPANRFDRLSLHVLGDHLDELRQTQPRGAQLTTATEADTTRTVINPVDSPDLPFRWTINPYRGCEHGCPYCYARPTHELLGYSCGIDFETRIIAKHDAPELLRRELAHRRWRPQPIVMSGVTDPYQPVEARLRITRGCLEVLSEARQPVSIITKNRLIVRDIDLLSRLNEHGAVCATISLTTLDARLARQMEPRASAPTDRLQAVRVLRQADIPTMAMLAPIIPGINDREIHAILEAAADAGAIGAGWMMLRLPYQVKSIFLDWLAREFPDRAAHVESLIREMRGRRLNGTWFGQRMRGRGAIAQSIHDQFTLHRRRLGLDHDSPTLCASAFRRPSIDGQMSLFE